MSLHSGVKAHATVACSIKKKHGCLFCLQAVNNHCFPAFLSIPPAQFKLVLDSIIWAFKHTMRNVADTGLQVGTCVTIFY
jgi:hypothetical protein